MNSSSLVRASAVVCGLWSCVAAQAAIEFRFAPQYPTGVAPQEADVADLDGDGDQDVVTANLLDQETGSFSVLINQGGGAFAPQLEYATGKAAVEIKLADFTGDGRPDVVVSNGRSGDTWGERSTVTVYRNAGNGTFVDRRDYDVGFNSMPEDIAIADFNGDGLADFAVACGNEYQVYVYLGDGLGSFRLQGAYRAESGAYLAAGDMDGDRRTDLVVGNVDAVMILRNTGSGFSQSAYFSNYPYTVSSVATGDFDGDGHADFAAAGSWLSVYRNSGNGTTYTRTLFPAGENQTGLEARDMDGDGSLDLVAPNYLGNSVSVYSNDGSGGFADRRDWGVGANPWGVAVGDVSGDGMPDIVAPNSQLSQTEVSVVANQGFRNYLARRDYGVNGYASGLAFADYDADGWMDVATGVYVSNRDNVTVFFGRPDGSLGAGTIIEEFGNNLPTDVATADFNMDGKPDIAASIFSPGNSVRVFLNNGDRTFRPSAVYRAVGNPSGVAAGDLTGDGTPDMVVSNGSLNANSISVYFNIGDGTFASQVIIPTLLQPSDVEMGDVDRDGDLDVIVTHGGANRILLFRNQGGGSLVGEQIAVGGPQGDSVCADFTGDGWPDLALSTGIVRLLPNDRTGNFGAVVDSTVPAVSVAAGDLDRDGDLDVIGIEGVRALLHVGANDGSGAFSRAGTMFTGYEPFTAGARDLDGDGYPEALSANGRSRSVSVFANLTVQSLRPLAPESFQVVRGVLRGGGLAELIVGDDQRLLIEQRYPFAGADPNASLVVETTCPVESPRRLLVALEASTTAAPAGRVRQRVELFNFRDARWEVADERGATSLDSFVEVRGAGALSRFVELGARRMRVRFAWFDRGTLTPGWQARIDQVGWTIGL